jgi:anti-sigma-K factor RskA
VNIQEYISSGIVESYVLGLASEEERREFEQYCTQYRELVEARNSFEIAIEKQAIENAIAPPSPLKNKILSARTGSAPVRKMNVWKYVAAACIILLAGSIYYNISLTGKENTTMKQLQALQGDMDAMKKDMEFLQQNPAVKMASMKGMDASPSSYATVYWDTLKHDVYLLINNLPAPASGKQYQVWALMDNKPIDLGMIDNQYFVSQKRLLIKAQNVSQAQAFAISLEDMGGNPTPKGDIYVMGKP